jgi:hypothetical protein
MENSPSDDEREVVQKNNMIDNYIEDKQKRFPDHVSQQDKIR